MNKKQYIEIVTRLVEIKKDEDALNVAFRKFEPDFNYISFNRQEALILDTLKIAMNDKDEWTAYFLYERNGKFTTKHIIKEPYGKTLPLENYGDLYDLITMK